MKTRILKLLLAVVLICLPQIGISNAYFFDQTTISGISVTTGDWTAPYVKIESPSHGQSLSGSIEIYGTVTDNAPYHYWLVVQTPGGSTVAGPGTVNDFVSFTNKLLFTWDTTKMANGSYIIKLEARDAAGNKDPNLSPVLVDPENPNDSVDWITVTVNNAPPTPTPIPTPTPTETVVINEIMWMGSSSHDNDEWIELRNTTNTTVNLAGWYLTGAGAGASVINLTGSIGPNGYYLVSNFNPDHPQSALKNSIVLDQPAANLSFLDTGEVIALYNSSNVVIDQTPPGSWVVGVNGPPFWKSMERNDNPTTGWHTCINVVCNDATYWDVEGNNYGTPKAANLSENDLSSLACVVPTVTLTPSVELTVAEDKKSASFSVKNISAYLKLSYELTYDSYDQTKGALGSGVDISGKTDFSREIDLATCSNEICTYDQNVHNFTIKITLEDTDAKQTILQQSL